MYSDDIDDVDELGFSAPQPVDIRALEDAGLELIDGAKSPLPAQHAIPAEKTKVDRLTLLAFVAGAILAAAAAAFALANLFAPAQAADEQTVEPEQLVVAANETITYRGRTYGIIDTEEGHALAELHGEDDPTALGDIAGSPAALILYKGALLIPENLVEGTWDVQAYTIGSGWSPLVDGEGNPRVGEGVVTAAAFDEADSTLLHLTVGEETVDVQLS